MRLRATTLLAENTTPLLHDTCRRLSETGIEIEFDDALDIGQRRDLVERGDIDLLWACGLLTAELIDVGLGLEVVAAPIFPGETEAVYRSLIVVRRGHRESMQDAIEGRLAVNEYGSWSGWHAYRLHLQSLNLSVDQHRTQVVTGSHHDSIFAMLDGVADVASIDSSLWFHLSEERHELSSLTVREQTRDWPAPPFSVGAGLEPVVHDLLCSELRSVDGCRAASIDEYSELLELSRV